MRRLIAVLACLLSTPDGASGRDEGDEGISARVDAVFRAMGPDAPGVAVLVVLDGKEVYKKGFGLANLESKARIGPGTGFRLASVSKGFTAMGIMILATREKLDYDDPLPLFFPGPRFPEGADRITVRTLLHHTSGLPEYEKLFITKGLIGENWPRSLSLTPEKFEPKSADVLNILRSERKLKFPPGAAFEYSNSGYVLLGQIIEKVSGKSYGEFLRQEVFEPLGMKQTLVSDGDQPPVRDRAVSYAKDDRSYREIDYTPLNGVFGDDGVYTTIDDMRRWADALDRGALVGRAALREAFRRGRLNNGEPTDYGFGWALDRFHNERLLWHNGAWIGFKSYIGRYPGRKLTVVVLANCRDTDVDKLGEEVAAIYLGPGEPAPEKGPLAPAENVRRSR